MGLDTPNVLSRETTFLMGFLKKCFTAEMVPISQEGLQGVQETNANNSVSFSDPTPGHSRHSVPSTEGVFCHLVPPMEENLCHSVKS